MTSFNIEHNQGTISIKTASSWNHNNILRNMVSLNNTIVVADVISSVSVLKQNASALETITRSYAPLWPIALGMADEENIIACNVGLLCTR